MGAGGMLQSVMCQFGAPSETDNDTGLPGKQQDFARFESSRPDHFMWSNS